MIPALLSCALLLSPAPEALVLRAGSDPVLVGRALRLTLAGAGFGSGEWEFPARGTELGTFLFLSGQRTGGAVWCEVLPTVSGAQTLPAFALRVPGVAGAAALRMTAPLAFSVGSALRPGEAPRLMDQLELERFGRTAWTWLWLLLSLIVLCGVAIRRLHQRRIAAQTRGIREQPVIQSEDPRVLALAELERLRRRGQPEGQAARSQLADLADVLRRYLAASVDAGWMFKSLEELEAQLAGLDRESSDGLPGQLLRQAELVKFAGRIPEPSGVSRLLEQSDTWLQARPGRTRRAIP